MIVQVNLNDPPGLAVQREWDGPDATGNEIPNAGQVAYTSDNPAVATVDSVTGQLAYIWAGDANISGLDPANQLTSTSKLTVVAPPPPPAKAVSATMSLVPGSVVAAAKK